MSSPISEKLQLESLESAEDKTSVKSEKDAQPRLGSLPEASASHGVSVHKKVAKRESLQQLLEDESQKNAQDVSPTWSESDADFVLPMTASLPQSNATPLESPSEQLSDVLVDDPTLSSLQIVDDDGFHAPTHTVIIPAIPSGSPKGSPGSVRGRFTVSPAQGIPGSVHMRRHVSGVPSHTSSHLPSRQQSTSTVTRASSPGSHTGDHSPEIQFKMSMTSLQRGEAKDTQYSGLDKHIEEENIKHAAPVRRGTEAEARRGTEPMIPTMEDLDEMFQDVDENQKTMRSVGGISLRTVDTQDSLTFEKSPFQCGNIRFIRDSYDSHGFQKKHYVCIPGETPSDDVTSFMSRFWGLRNPKIVLSVISDISSLKTVKNQRLKDDFEKGIIKAANTTNMWIITNGVDRGISKVIGDAIRQEKIQQINSQVMANPVVTGSEQRKKRLTLIGIVPKDMVAYGVYFDGTDGVQIKNEGQNFNTDICELNPDHTNFIMIEDEGKDIQFTNTRFSIEKELQTKYGPPRKIRLMSLDPTVAAQGQRMVMPESTIPVVGLLVQGGPRNIDHVLLYLQNKMPIIVLKGSGGLADLIAYAYEELLERGDDLDYQENFLKPELIKLLMKLYASKFEDNDLAKFSLRDKIIECARLATETSEDQTNLTVVNIKGWGSSLKDLDKFILMALFKAGKHEGGHWQQPLQNDLQLAVDWNRPDLAAQIFQQDFTRVRVDKSMFEQSLLKKDREELIELFLSQGVRVHKFLNHKKMKLLFEKAEDREFFLNVCMEQVLGLFLFPDQELASTFLSEHLNRLIYKLTGITDFVQPYKLSMNFTGMYIIDAITAERRAMNSLMIWAVLMNRHKLAKTLWTKCDQPICIALICSMVYSELSKYNMEQFQKTEMEDRAREFGEMALGILAVCWQENSVMAYNILSKRNEDFNNKTVIEIAYDTGYIHFLAHPCCQKWLTKTFFGNLQFKELDWGLFRLPYWFKVLTSAFLILPMYFWITFIPPKKKKTFSDEGLEYDEDEDEEDNSDEEDAPMQITKSSIDMTLGKKKDFIGKRILRTTFSFRHLKKDAPFWQKIYLLWTAPITKFWVSQMFYFIYLAVFCFATLWPTCGNIFLDIVLWLWTAVILLELVCRVYMKYHRSKTLSLVTNCIEIFLITLFLLALLVMRILQNWVFLTNYIHSKTILCFGLIYFFYRLLGIYLLISPTLGPMLLRITRMIKYDLSAFIRMFLIFMIAGGVTIQAVIYPNWPINLELIKRVITRPIYGMFLTQVDDLDGNPSCTPMYYNTTGYCAADAIDAQKLQKCPYSSFSGYLITLQYLLICKLVLVTLLFAMFALTIAKVDKEASQIWKYQRYELIADVQERFSLPPPFTVISILLLFLKLVFKKLKYCCRRCLRLSSCLKPKKSHFTSSRNRTRKQAHDDTSFWKQCAREYMAIAEAEKEKEQMTEKHGDILISLTEDLRGHRKNMKRLSDRVVELERMVKASRLYLEDISHKLDKTDVMGITDVKGQFIHVAARQSPYPGTSITRFPVFDKYVPWEITYDVYDPKTYTLPKENFPETEMSCVDVDLLGMKKSEEHPMATEDGRGLPTLQEEVVPLSPAQRFKPKWNAVVTYKEKGVRREVDRRSWIDKNNQPLRYCLDPLGIPVNPMGRTGIRGKGALWRWGPNHVIKAVITRWRRKYSADLLPTASYLYVEGKRVLEFITVPISEFSEGLSEVNYGLPGDVLHGLSNTYSILCQAFMTYVLEQPDSEQGLRFDQTDMIQFFAQFSKNVSAFTSTSMTSLPYSEGALSRTASRTVHPRLSESYSVKPDTDQGFTATLLYKGYLDDPRNTDSAWVEAEVWNFHYDLGDDFDMQLKTDSGVKWKEVSPYVKMFGNESVIVQEAAKIHDAYH